MLLDAGHGGNATGAVVEDAIEKHIALQVTLATGKILNHVFPGIDVCYTRIQDKAVSLTARYNLIKAIEPNAFVSIHCNAVNNPDVNGFEVFYRDAYDIDLAKSIHQLFKRANISNAMERDKILQSVHNIADLIGHGIAHYFEEAQNKDE